MGRRGRGGPCRTREAAPSGPVIPRTPGYSLTSRGRQPGAPAAGAGGMDRGQHL